MVLQLSEAPKSQVVDTTRNTFLKKFIQITVNAILLNDCNYWGKK